MWDPQLTPDVQHPSTFPSSPPSNKAEGSALPICLQLTSARRLGIWRPPVDTVIPCRVHKQVPKEKPDSFLSYLPSLENTKPMGLALGIRTPEQD